MFRVLADEGINIEMIATSEIKISVVVNAKYGELAMRALHDAFLGEGSNAIPAEYGLSQWQWRKKYRFTTPRCATGASRRTSRSRSRTSSQIAERLDDLGIDYIEGGWPGSNARDAAFFSEVKKLKLRHAKIAAFGSTRRANARASADRNLQLLLRPRRRSRRSSARPGTCTCARLCGFRYQANLEILHDTIAYLKKHVDEVIFDAEHFFDGYRD